ncbi:pyridoxamine 5'-phosphate oxidase family protein [Phycicoccus sp. M110.8]|uniref:pyridoxamine 5'-phosphate oxidase family protein n=1 Tax=Phycicoccus sp. M110.8 TaxID=3075433 RepID=UPI0028FDA976|nr:pyridoxamine 5'-phosphate oxidase family protein [Phycicoccus sp. M110.8]MDU0314910.1 pyridoxamine 5'-phosphate oxidase family protein [Phycicoccus sp. M110.8]
MNADQLAAVLAKPIAQELLTGPHLARLAYTGLDGAPRVVPIGFLWNGTQVDMWTVPGSAKVRALAADPRVALTIDTAGMPPRVLLLRGTAELTTIEGIPEGYLAAAPKAVPADQLEQWEAGVRALYDSMVQVRVTPTWATLHDFETTLPKAVQDLLDAKAAEQA